ncbi:DUF4292 domain-containing protein [Flavobacterium sp. NST-5]|uniref:DUF4292 domain-containing protein n=1 Tax=Flavobacterium ichthyis TaxID=2698827 RepID=A0ABW9Z932_9FLAO|nr:DUF4292 domain-containing protein [Flavobacterium ichthyis]NBL65380.1 DUF4292 domain-containing protein [Flavobacterium ichthyis]
MKKILTTLFAMVLVACGSKKNIVSEENAAESISSKSIVENHYKINRDFKTLYIKSNVKYSDPKLSQSVSAEIRMDKDKQILVSIRLLGITWAKAYITPKEVKYYEKINGKFFEGNYNTLSKWLGTDLDFSKVQNMLVGQAMDDLDRGKYKATIENSWYKLEDLAKTETNKSFFFEAGNFLIKKQEIVQAEKNRSLTVFYPAHKEHPKLVLPAKIDIMAQESKKTTEINIEYNSVTFDENLSFPYSVPDGYEKINID